VSTIAATPTSGATGNFTRMLFSVFERAGIRYCVLHGWEELPETVSSDLDLVVHPEDFSKLQIVFPELAAAGYKWIQCRNYAGCSYRFDFAWFEGKRFHVVGVDCIFEYRYGGLILRSGEDLLKDRRQHDGFWIASSETAFAYMLMKKSLKAAIFATQLLELQEISAEIGSERSLRIASDVFGEENGARVVAAIADHSLPAILPKLRAHLTRTVLKRNPWNFVRYHAHEIPRLVKRWFQPTGLILIALGPDGVGKSATLAEVVENLKPAFRETYFFHYLATFSNKSDTPVTNPHAKAPRGPVLSVARVLVLFIQFWASYLVIVRPKLGRSGLVIFDRYFHDLLVDHWRYRYSGPQWLLRLLLRLIPSKDVFLLVLDADETVIYSRKQEVPVEHLRTLRQGYKLLVSNSSSAVLIRTDQDLGDTTTAATEAVYRHLLSRWSRRHPQWTKGYVTTGDTKAVPFERAS
jgi:thymidylate kinase